MGHIKTFFPIKFQATKLDSRSDIDVSAIVVTQGLLVTVQKMREELLSEPRGEFLLV